MCFCKLTLKARVEEGLEGTDESWESTVGAARIWARAEAGQRTDAFKLWC